MADIKVIKRDPATGRLSFEIQNAYVSGLDLLVQMVVLDLLSSPGSDVLDPDIGSGIPDLIGSNWDPSDPADLLSDISDRVAKTEARILSDQIGVALPLEERLRKITVVSLTPVEEESRVDLRLRIENEAGRTTSVIL